MVYFPPPPPPSGPLGTGEPQKCPGCGDWYVPTPGMENTSCAVLHGPGSCCHYSETRVAPPLPDAARAAEEGK